MTRLSDTLTCSEDGWRLVESGWDRDRGLAVGSNFMVGNGYLGFRGTAAEHEADGYVALVVTDTYDMADGRWRELCTVPNPLFVQATVAGALVSVDDADEVVTELDLRRAEFTQRAVHDVDGTRVEVRCQRVASIVDLHLLAQRWELRTDRPVAVDLAVGIDGRVWSLNGDHFAQMLLGEHGDQLSASVRTVERGTTIVVSAESQVTGAAVTPGEIVPEDRRLLRRYTATVAPGSPLVVETATGVSSSNDGPDPSSRVTRTVRSAAATGYQAVADASAAGWSPIWDRADVVIEGSAIDQVSLRFCTYHNRISTPAHTDHLPIGARGLSCQAYQGAAFWDQEIYNLPVFLTTEPEIARRLLVYRHRTLDGARRKARRLGYEGAFYAWISGDTGDELCPDIFFVDVLTGRPIRNHFNVWQIHVAPDVVTALDHYVRVTGDTDLLRDHGAEIAFEVARFLRSRVLLDERHGTYRCIRLLGPDEWHENVDDNAFTNYQVHAALDVAVRTHAWLASHEPDALAALSAALDLHADEVHAWARIRDHLYLPQPDPDSGLIEQFVGFFALEDVTPDELRRRLRDPQEYWGWPNGVAVRTQVSKQADVPVLLWQHHHRFAEPVVAANYRYYEPRCAHASTLSHPPFGFAAVRMADLDRALAHFRATATVDLLTTAHAVVGGTFIGGIHTAACGGAYQLAVHGFGGLDIADGQIRVDPRLPGDWTALTYPVTFRGRRLRVTATPDDVEVTLVEGDPLDVLVRGEPLTLARPGSGTNPGSPRMSGSTGSRNVEA